jgi:hypothetical protein
MLTTTLAAIGDASLHVDDLLRSVPSVARLALGIGARPDDVVAAFVVDLDDYLATVCDGDLTETAMIRFRLRSVARLTDAVRAEVSQAALATAV